MTANNLEELTAMLLKEADKAMEVASEKALADMQSETKGFYNGKQPVLYERTDALKKTPRVSKNISRIKNRSSAEVYFNAYLDQKHHYTTGDKPYMDVVLSLANDGIPWVTKNNKTARDTVGRKGFWERAEKKMEKDLDRTLKKYFK